MKKLIALIVIFVCVGAALSAQINISAGAGATFGNMFTSHSYTDAGKPIYEYADSRYMNGSIFAFLDATYAEFDVGYRFGVANASKYPSNTPSDYKKGLSNNMLAFNLLAKYPIPVGGFTVFPLAGIGFDYLLSSKNRYVPEGGKKENDLSNLDFNDRGRFSVKFGVGGDINVTEQIYIRPSFLYGISLRNSDERDAYTKARDSTPETLKSQRNHLFEFRVAAGFKF